MVPELFDLSIMIPTKKHIDLSSVIPFPEEIPRELLGTFSFDEWIAFLERNTTTAITTVPQRKQIQLGNGSARFPFYKIHMMFRHEFFPFVVDRLLKHLHLMGSTNIKLLTRPLTTKPDEWYTFPIDDLQNTDQERGASPLDISSLELRDEFGNSTFRSDGVEYRYETLFLPKIVFYPDEYLFLEDFISLLLALFPEENIGPMIETHYYPRFNLRLNSVLFIANGNADDKHLDIEKKADHFNIKKNAYYKKPDEYIELEKTCHSKATKQACLNQNQLSNRISNQNVCDWEGTCIPTRQFSSNLLMTDISSLEKFYTKIGHPELLGSKSKRKKSKKRKNSKKQFFICYG